MMIRRDSRLGLAAMVFVRRIGVGLGILDSIKLC